MFKQSFVLILLGLLSITYIEAKSTIPSKLSLAQSNDDLDPFNFDDDDTSDEAQPSQPPTKPTKPSKPDTQPDSKPTTKPDETRNATKTKT
jgi:hypothetical protein